MTTTTTQPSSSTLALEMKKRWDKKRVVKGGYR